MRPCSRASTRLVTINSALEVDLTGQVNAEQSGSVYMGGTGGQVDFVRAGARSPGGHSIIALPATAKGNELSRITIGLSGPVTTARSEVDVIVTEFGAAELRGQTLAERTRRLIAIAHPDFREELERAAHTIAAAGVLMSDAVLFDARDDGIAIITIEPARYAQLPEPRGARGPARGVEPFRT
jgi:acyl-CoA hydrolase